MNNCNEGATITELVASNAKENAEQRVVEPQAGAIHSDCLESCHQMQSRAQCFVEEECEVQSLNWEEHSLHVWKGVSRCFAQSSFHGIPFLAIMRSNTKMIFWIIILSTAFILMFLSLNDISTKYALGRIYISTGRRFPKELPFPAVTICNINPFKVTAVLANNMSLYHTNLFLTYIRARNRIPLPASYFIPLVQQYDMVSGGNNTFYQDLGHKINDLVLSCTFDGKICSVNNFTARATSSGLCHTFNPKGDFSHYYSSKHGYRYGLIIRLNIEQYEYFSSEITSAGLNVFVHDHGHFPYTGSHRNLLLSPGQGTLLTVTKTDYTRLSPPRGICNDHVKLTLFRSYTRESCLIECETRLAIKTCGCKAEYMPGSDITCTLNQTLYCLLPQAKTFQPEHCDCPVSCSETVYNTHLSYSRYPAFHQSEVYNNSYFLQSGVIPVPSFAIFNYTDANGTVISYLRNSVTPAGLRANYLKLAVYYDAMEYNLVTEELQYTSGRFFADFTGFIGFFIGAGFLSIFEVMELIHSLIKPPR